MKLKAINETKPKLISKQSADGCMLITAIFGGTFSSISNPVYGRFIGGNL